METTMRDALEVVLTWDGVAQRQELYAKAKAVVVGEAETADFMLPREVLASDHVIAEPIDGAWTVHLPAGAIAHLGKDGETVELPVTDGKLALAPGMRAAIELGAFCFHLRATDAPKITAAPVAFDMRSWGWVIASVAFHGAMLLTFLMMPPRASAISMDLDQDQARYVMSRLLPVEPPIPPMPEPTPAGAGGAEGRPHTGEEGAAGQENAPADRGGGVRRRGPADRTLIPTPSAQDARNVGVLRYLGDAVARLSPISSPYGVDDAPAGDEVDAYGALGRMLGIGDGNGGIGVVGTGRGTCPPGATNCANGTIGVGDGDRIGTGTCTQAQFDSIMAREGRAAAVAACRGQGPGIGNDIGNGDRTARVPTLRPSTADVMPGGLGREQIRRTVQRHLPEIRHCYEQALQTRPELEGRVTVAFMVRQDGSVESSMVVNDSTGINSMSSCMATAVRRWSFPQAPSPTFVRSYPFVMNAN